MTDTARMFDPLDPDELNDQSKADAGWTVITPVPDSVELNIPRHPAGKPTAFWIYRNAVGRVLFAKVRFDMADGSKLVLPLSYGSEPGSPPKWQWKGVPQPRPLYGLDRLAGHPDAAVLVVEGEKAADAATALFPDMVAVTSPDGAGAANKADWSPLAGRRVAIWPDNDTEGQNYANSVIRMAQAAGADSVALVTIPDTFPTKWDLADPMPDGVTLPDLKVLLDAADGVKPPAPDMTVLGQGRRAPPEFPLEVFGPWAEWIEDAAEGAGCPVDYVVGALFSALTVTVGHSRIVMPWDNWSEPSILWMACVGDPSSGKSPGADAVMRALRQVEKELAEGFEDEYRRWEADAEIAKATHDAWKGDVSKALKDKATPPDKPLTATAPPEPSRPRIIINDATPEAVATVLLANPRGVLMQRDELAGWIGSFNQYNSGGAGQAFWIESYGARPFTIDRVKNNKAVFIPRLAVSVLGNIQPDKLSALLSGDDDGLVARFLWAWPDPVPPTRPVKAASLELPVNALRRLARLQPLIADDGTAQPEIMKLDDDAARAFQEWRVAHFEDRRAGKLASAFGKMGGHVLRLALVLELAWWSVVGGQEPDTVSHRALLAAVTMVERYWKPMAERVYGDASVLDAEKNAAVLARWIRKVRPSIVNAREIGRTAGLPGLRDPNAVKAAIGVLEDARWLTKSARPTGGRHASDYDVNPAIWDQNDGDL
jgi:hypothetical protein